MALTDLHIPCYHQLICNHYHYTHTVPGKSALDGTMTTAQLTEMAQGFAVVFPNGMEKSLFINRPMLEVFDSASNTAVGSLCGRPSSDSRVGPLQ